MGTGRGYAGGRRLTASIRRRDASMSENQASVSLIAEGKDYELLGHRGQGLASSCAPRPISHRAFAGRGCGALSGRLRGDHSCNTRTGSRTRPSPSSGTRAAIAGSQHRTESDHGNAVKTTQDGRKLEVIGLAICLDGQLEAFELIEVKLHPNQRAIWTVMPEATHMAGRVALTREEADDRGRRLQGGRGADPGQPRRHQRALPDRSDVEGPRAGHRIVPIAIRLGDTARA